MSKPKIEFSNDLYRVVAPDGTEGPLVEYGDIAIVEEEATGEIYYSNMANAQDAKEVVMVAEVNPTPCDCESVEFEDEDEEDEEGDDDEDAESDDEPETGDPIEVEQL